MSRYSSKIFVEHRSDRFISGVRDESIRRFCTASGVTVVDHEEQCNVKVVFCPIVSRAGTNIEAALSHITDNKPTIMMVLHTTIDPDTVVPKSSRYENKNLLMMDVLFCDYQGLLECPQNNEAFRKAMQFIMQNASTLPVSRRCFFLIKRALDVVKRHPVITLVVVLCTGYMWKTRNLFITIN